MNEGAKRNEQPRSILYNPRRPGQGKRHRKTTRTRHAGTTDARPPAARRVSCRAPRRRCRRAAVPAAATVAVMAAATAAAPPPMQRHSWYGGGGRGVEGRGVGGTDSTAPTEGDAVRGGRSPPRAAPPDDTSGATAAHVVAGAVRVSDPALPRGAVMATQRHTGGTRCARRRRRRRRRHPPPCRHRPVTTHRRPRRWRRPPPTAGRPRLRPRARVSRHAAATGRRAAAASGTGGGELPPPPHPPPPVTARLGTARRHVFGTAAAGRRAPRARRHHQPQRLVWPTAAASPPPAPTGINRNGCHDRRWCAILCRVRGRRQWPHPHAAWRRGQGATTLRRDAAVIGCDAPPRALGPRATRRRPARAAGAAVAILSTVTSRSPVDFSASAPDG